MRICNQSIPISNQFALNVHARSNFPHRFTGAQAKLIWYFQQTNIHKVAGVWTNVSLCGLLCLLIKHLKWQQIKKTPESSSLHVGKKILVDLNSYI